LHGQNHIKKGIVLVCERNIVEETRRPAESGRLLFVVLWYLHSFALQTSLYTEWPESNLKAIFWVDRRERVSMPLVSTDM